MALNHGKRLESGSLHERFEKYPPPQWGFGPDAGYNNPHNPRFSNLTGNSKYRVQKAHVYSDESILEKIRSIFCSVTADGKSTDLSIIKLNQLVYPHTKSVEIARLFQEAVIECGESMVDEYLKILFRFRGTNSIEKSVRKDFVKLILQEFKNPSKFADTRIELGVNKERRWRTINSLIIAKLAVTTLNIPADIRQQFSFDNIFDRFLKTIIQNIQNGQADDINVICLIVPVLRKNISFIKDERYEVLMQQLDNISANNSYPPLLRAQLMDVIGD